MFCPNCGTSNNDTARFCHSCGGAISTTTPAVYAAPPPPVLPHAPQPHQLMRGAPGPVARAADRHYLALGRKSPIAAAILSMLVIGLGQLYNGDFKKGLVMFFGVIVLCTMVTVLFFVIWPGFAIWSVIDAYNVARGKSPLW